MPSLAAFFVGFCIEDRRLFVAYRTGLSWRREEFDTEPVVRDIAQHYFWTMKKPLYSTTTTRAFVLPTIKNTIKNARL
jgi:hypothetical protein